MPCDDKGGVRLHQTEELTLLKKIQAMEDPDAVQIYSVTVKGTDVATGKPIERIYNGCQLKRPWC